MTSPSVFNIARPGSQSQTMLGKRHMSILLLSSPSLRFCRSPLPKQHGTRSVRSIDCSSQSVVFAGRVVCSSGLSERLEGHDFPKWVGTFWVRGQQLSSVFAHWEAYHIARLRRLCLPILIDSNVLAPWNFLQHLRTASLRAIPAGKPNWMLKVRPLPRP